MNRKIRKAWGSGRVSVAAWYAVEHERRHKIPMSPERLFYGRPFGK